MSKEEHNEQSTDQSEPTVKVAEMKRRLASVEQKHQEKIDALQEQQAELIEQAVEKARAEAQMSEKELRTFREKEAERKREEKEQAYQAQIDQLLSEKKQREIRDEAIQTLNDLSIKVDEKTLALVTADSLDGMSEKAQQLAKVIQELKNDYAASAPPNVSSRLVSGEHTSRADFFKAGNIIKQNKGV